jgi:hypothetical protein
LYYQIDLMIEQLKLGDHAALFFKTNEERLTHAIAYLIQGLQNNERCLYIADENTVFEVLVRFHQAGVDVRKAQRRGALSVVTKRETYLRHGPFEPEKMIADLHSEVKYSLEHAFAGLRATGEMSWALDLPGAFARLFESEEQLQKLWPAEFGALCQYNETLFSPELVEKMIGLHSIIIRGGKIIRRDSYGAPKTASTQPGFSLQHQ